MNAYERNKETKNKGEEDEDADDKNEVNSDDDGIIKGEGERFRAECFATKDEKVDRYASNYFDTDEIGDYKDDKGSSEHVIVRTRSNLLAYDHDSGDTNRWLG